MYVYFGDRYIVKYKMDLYIRQTVHIYYEGGHYTIFATFYISINAHPTFLDLI